MKLYAAAVLGFASLVLASPFSPRVAHDVQASQSIEKRDVNAEVLGLRFDWDGDGRKLYLPGTNAYWTGFLTENYDVDLVFSHLNSSYLNVLRVWGFNDITQSTTGVWYQSLIPGTTPQINTGPNGLQRLDYVVQSAEAHGIKLIINFVNNWSDYGGIPAYNAYFGTNTTTWYTDPRVQAQYQKYVETVVCRYRNSSAVFAWELANEPRCHSYDPSVFTTWATTTSAFIKSLDPSHMITTGEEGFMNGGGDGSYVYTTGEGMDFEANLKIPDISFGTFHLYPASWGESDALTFGNDWIVNHGAICTSVGKPCILEEYGDNSNLTLLLSWQTAALNTVGIGGDLFWQYGDTLSYGETPQDGNTIYYNSSAYEQVVTQHIQRIVTSYYEPIDR